MLNKQNKVRYCALLTMFCLATISLSKTSNLHAKVIDGAKYVLIVIALSLVIVDIYMTIRKRTVSKAHMSIFLCTLLFFMLGITQSFVFGGGLFFISNPQLILYAFFAVLFSWVLGAVSYKSGSIGIDKFLSRWLPIYFFIVLLVAFFCGGVSIEFPPKFIFGDGEVDSYSQGISKLFSLAAIISLASSIKYEEKRKLNSIFSLLFLFMAFLGGGRGDFIFGALLYLLILTKWKKKLLLFIVITVLIFSIFGFSSIDFDQLSDDFYMVNRMLQLGGGNLGMRDILAIDAVDLLNTNTDCLLFGCGFNYFQSYYNYRVGLYPHNIYLEMAITFGVPFTLLFVGLLIAGIVYILKSSAGLDSLLLLTIYLLFVGLKSGTLIDLILVGLMVRVIAIFILNISIGGGGDENHTHNKKYSS